MTFKSKVGKVIEMIIRLTPCDAAATAAVASVLTTACSYRAVAVSRGSRCVMVMGPAVAQEGWEAARQTVIAVPHIEPDGCRAAVSQVLSATGSKKKVLSATSGGLAAGLHGDGGHSRYTHAAHDYLVGVQP